MFMQAWHCSRLALLLIRIAFFKFAYLIYVFRRFSIMWMFPNFSPNYHCFHMDGNCYNEPQIAVGHFKKYFKYILYITSMNIVMSSSKDWPFNQILAC